MKATQNIRKRGLILALGLTLSTFCAQAQITFNDDVNDEAPAAPIDGMVGLGLAAGAYFGLRKKFKSQE